MKEAALSLLTLFCCANAAAQNEPPMPIRAQTSI